MESQYTDNAEPVWKGVTLSVIALLVFIMIAVFNGTCRYLEYKAYVRIYSSLLVSIYKKVQFKTGSIYYGYLILISDIFNVWE